MIDWVQGDALGLQLPAHSGALKAGGAAFLTQAFHTSGALPLDNRVARITRLEECAGGSTGRKLLLCVTYAQPSPDLHTELFVKFSRDFQDDMRDRARFQMEREVQFALLSRSPEFPIAVPTCYFSDYHQASGTGILITERVPFGNGSIEAHYEKCLDYEIPELVEHYKVLLSTLARLAGTHKTGRLPDMVERHFPFDPSKLSVGKRQPYSPQQIANRVARYADFASNYPQVLPANIRCAEFTARLAEEAPRFMSLVSAANTVLASKPEFIALCHWNANVDNGWFWRDEGGELRCGLLDWGNVSQMNVAMALWGCMSAAETDIWDHHLDELLNTFIVQFRNCGGPALDAAELKQHILLYAGIMGLTWLLDAPALILARVPDLSQVTDRFDPHIRDDETTRAQLHIMTVFLNLWETQDMGTLLRELEAHSH